jgi:hypothetical protein
MSALNPNYSNIHLYSGVQENLTDLQNYARRFRNWAISLLSNQLMANLEKTNQQKHDETQTSSGTVTIEHVDNAHTIPEIYNSDVETLGAEGGKTIKKSTKE